MMRSPLMNLRGSDEAQALVTPLRESDDDKDAMRDVGADRRAPYLYYPSRARARDVRCSS